MDFASVCPTQTGRIVAVKLANTALQTSETASIMEVTNILN